MYEMLLPIIFVCLF